MYSTIYEGVCVGDVPHQGAGLPDQQGVREVFEVHVQYQGEYFWSQFKCDPYNIILLLIKQLPSSNYFLCLDFCIGNISFSHASPLYCHSYGTYIWSNHSKNEFSERQVSQTFLS